MCKTTKPADEDMGSVGAVSNAMIILLIVALLIISSVLYAEINKNTALKAELAKARQAQGVSDE